MKYVIYIILILFALLGINGLYFEYIVNREVHFMVIPVATFFDTIFTICGLGLAMRYLFKLLK